MLNYLAFFNWVFHFLLLFDFRFAFAVEYGPSFDYLIPVDQSKSLRRKEIYLETYFPSYSIVLPLANGSSSAHVLNVHPNGEFLVYAPPDHGLMVVVQALRLRTSIIYSDAEDSTFLKCRDYLKFHAGNQTSQVCGHVTQYSKEGNPGGLLGPRAFITSERMLSIALHIDRHLADNDYGYHEAIVTEIVITAFKECPKNTFVSQWMKWTGSSQIRSCSPSEDRICIFSSSFCDGVANCGVKGPLGHIGYDEENCNPFRIGPPPADPPLIRVTPLPPLTSTSSKPPYIGVNKPYSPPTSGTVVSPIHLILIFSVVVLLVFALCTWLAKANEKKFQHTMYRFSTMRRNRRNNRPQQRNSDETLGRLPSAPPESNSNTLGGESVDIEAVEISSIPGEQPPPYADLFPTAPPISSTP